MSRVFQPSLEEGIMRVLQDFWLFAQTIEFRAKYIFAAGLVLLGIAAFVTIPLVRWIVGGVYLLSTTTLLCFSIRTAWVGFRPSRT